MTVESNKRPLSSLSDTPPRKRPCKEKPCSKMDDAIAAMLEQHNLEFRNALERARHVQAYNEKHEANEREIKNDKHGIFKLPPELRRLVYEHVYADQVLDITMLKDQARLARAARPYPLALSNVCRLIHKDIAELPFLLSSVTFKLITFRYVSMLDTWQDAIRVDSEKFVGFLKSIPANEIERFEVVGVMGGWDGIEAMKVTKIKHWWNFLDYKTEMKGYIYQVYPKAEVTFRDVDDIAQLWRS